MVSCVTKRYYKKSYKSMCVKVYITQRDAIKLLPLNKFKWLKDNTYDSIKFS